MKFPENAETDAFRANFLKINLGQFLLRRTSKSESIANDLTDEISRLLALVSEGAAFPTEKPISIDVVPEESGSRFTVKIRWSDNA